MNKATVAPSRPVVQPWVPTCGLTGGKLDMRGKCATCSCYDPR